MATISSGNYTVGGAHLYYSATIGHVDLLGTAFETTDHNMGNIVTSEISPDVTYLDHYISVNGKRVKDKIVSTMSSVTIPFTFDEMNAANMAKFFMGDLTASKIKVVQNELEEGCAKLVVQTSIGRDLVYNIPKCTIRPDGAISMNEEDWHTAPMVLEVLQYQADDGNSTDNATWVAAPFGQVDISDRA